LNSTNINFSFDNTNICELIKERDLTKTAYMVMNETTALFMKKCNIDGSNYPYDCKYYQGCKVLFDNDLQVGEIRFFQ
jgi:hypothetical protein